MILLVDSKNLLFIIFQLSDDPYYEESNHNTLHCSICIKGTIALVTAKVIEKNHPLNDTQLELSPPFEGFRG